MPTGYTADIENGISFKEFALQCAHAFGACIMQRDESFTTPLKRDIPSKHYQTGIEKANKALEKLQNASPTQLETQFIQYLNKGIKRNKKYKQHKLDLLSKYNNMLFKVKDWIPPTDEHTELKKFMIQQIEDSIDWDCKLDWVDDELERLNNLTLEEWLKGEIDSHKHTLEYYTKEAKKEIDRCNSRNEWKDQLIESLK